MSAPQQLTPAYLGSSKTPQSSNPLTAFWRSQVIAPEHRADNLVILRAVTVFAVGVAFVRSGLSSALVPIF
ncbi:hypothetical protein BCR39DRAFT_515372 [Naematelia encephala]|uniref:TOM core complex subunit Tom6 n=1 Tax=Naematelia encephala TaxID=71784 RepID=A0A1Y2BLA1_9TREE|nr:hypothetical protein BCR39DRAFT_515372 [Naematelia encephala]